MKFPLFFFALILAAVNGCTKSDNAPEPIRATFASDFFEPHANAALRAAQPAQLDTIVVSYEPQSGTVNYDYDGYVKRPITHPQSIVRLMPNAMQPSPTATVARGLRLWAKQGIEIVEVLSVDDAAQWTATPTPNGQAFQVWLDEQSFLSAWQGNEFRLTVVVER